MVWIDCHSHNKKYHFRYLLFDFSTLSPTFARQMQKSLHND
jgi:hypothetical protein